MIYWFTGQPGHGKTFLGEQLTEFLKTERRNWRRDVFYIDAETLEDTSPYNDLLDESNTEIVKNAQLISSFLNENMNDVVVSLISPRLDIRETFKARMKNNLTEIYVFNTDKRRMKLNQIEWYEPPIDNFISIDTTNTEPIDSYTKLINILRNETLI